MANNQLVKYCQEKGVAVTAWGPLAFGKSFLLNKGGEEDVLKALCKKKGHSSVAETALRWTLQQKVCVIPASTNAEHVRQNLLIGLKGDKNDSSEKAVAQASKELTPDEAFEVFKKCNRNKRRAPDLIGVWPVTCNDYSLVLGRLLALLITGIAMVFGGIDVLKLRRWWVLRKKKQRFPELAAE